MNNMEDMLKLEIYVGESEKHDGKPLWKTLLRRLQEKGIAGASAFRGVAGYGAGGEIHSLEVLRLSEDLPVLVVAVDVEEKIEEVLPDVRDLVKQGLVLTSSVKGIQKG